MTELKFKCPPQTKPTKVCFDSMRPHFDDYRFEETGGETCLVRACHADGSITFALKNGGTFSANKNGYNFAYFKGVAHTIQAGTVYVPRPEGFLTCAELGVIFEKLKTAPRKKE